MKRNESIPGTEEDIRAGAQPAAAENSGGTPPGGATVQPLPDAEKTGESGNPQTPSPQPEVPGTKAAVIRHRTQYPKYRCAALVLTKRLETYQVTEAQLEKLRRDPWVVIEQDKKEEPEKE
jgi:hypothetical protein